MLRLIHFSHPNHLFYVTNRQFCREEISQLSLFILTVVNRLNFAQSKSTIILQNLI